MRLNCFTCVTPGVGPCQKLYTSISRMSTMARDTLPKDIYKKFNSDSRDIFRRALDTVLPASMVRYNLKVNGDILQVGSERHVKEFSLDKNVHIVACGKAVVGMVRAAEAILGDHIQNGIASIPVNYINTFESLHKPELLPGPDSKVKYYEGAADNLADEASYGTAKKIMELAGNLKENDIMLTLISGGGSSLLACPTPPVSIQELREVTKLMSTNGATISQMNVVRKQLESLKGGGLAKHAQPATTVALILSDVIGDCLETIASGPTVPDYSTPEQCFNQFKQLDIIDKVPSSVFELLEKHSVMRSPASGHVATLTNSHNFLVGSNVIATEQAAVRARECGYIPYILSTSIWGEARSAGEQYARIARFMCQVMGNKFNDSREAIHKELELIELGISKAKLNDLHNIADESRNTRKPICIICGGETVVNVKGTGLGGRNQEMALSCALAMDETRAENAMLDGQFAIQFFSAATDGLDGPCDSAGALVTPHTVSHAVENATDAQKYLDNNDSFHFFEKLNNGSNHIITGQTGTNVMDIQFLMMKPLF